MRYLRITVVFAAVAVLALGDVKTQEKSQVKFEGMMGRMMGLFGGKAAQEGQLSTVAVKGNRKMRVNDTTGELIDLDEEKIYHLDMRRKQYEVTTFADLRRQMEEARARAAEQAKSASGGQAPPQPDRQMAVDFSAKDSGQKRTINGFECREVVMTVTVRERDKTVEQSGGMVLTSNMWLAPRVEAMKEVAEFDRRYIQKLQLTMGIGSVEQMAAALAMYPGMKDAMARFQAENVNMDGTPILTETKMEAVKTAEQLEKEKAQGQQGESADITSVRGILGGLGRRGARKKTEGEGAGEGPQRRATVVTMNQELVRVSADVAPADVSIPAGFKEKK